MEGLDKILEKIHLTPYNKKIHKSKHPPCIYYSALCTVCHRSMFIHSAKGTSLHSVQFSSVTQSCPMLCDPMNCSTPGLPVHHQLPEFTQTHVHWVNDAIQRVSDAIQRIESQINKNYFSLNLYSYKQHNMTFLRNVMICPIYYITWHWRNLISSLI